jgi:hypothetical protein
MSNIQDKFMETEGIVDRLVMEVMREVYARLPYNQKFTLSDGSIAYIKKFSEPKLRDDGQRGFGFDVKIEGGQLDHIEFAVRDSGFGRALSEGIIDDTPSTPALTL